jgi:hypothetical protein
MMADKKEWLPWYRRKGYRGNLSEEEKRALDSFRMKEPHPSARYEQLPEEVQSYISRLEMELYDKKQEGAADKALVLTGVAALSVWFGYMGYGKTSPLFSYLLGAALLVAAWVRYRWEWNKNADALFPKGKGAPADITDEELRYEWELENIVRHKNRKNAEPDEWDLET